MTNKRKDLTGQRFYKLIVREFSGKKTKSNNAIWVCDCDCGGVRYAVGTDLTCGKAKSCGCYRKTQHECSVAGCSDKAKARHLCNKHYHRWRKPVKTSNDIYERIAMKTIRAKNGCIEWTGVKSPEGYGQTSFQGKKYNLHRLAWILEHGEIDNGLFVCHKCDNPACLNTDHLFLGTQKDNIHDAIRKGRFDPQRMGKLQRERLRG